MIDGQVHAVKPYGFHEDQLPSQNGHDAIRRIHVDAIRLYLGAVVASSTFMEVTF